VALNRRTLISSLTSRASGFCGKPVGAIDPHRDLPPGAPQPYRPSPALSIIGKAPKPLKGRAIALLVSDGVDCALIEGLRKAVHREGARLKIVAPHLGGTKTGDGTLLEVDQQLAGAPSIFSTRWQ
jgi:catalase